MHEAPDNKGLRCAMPEAAEEIVMPKLPHVRYCPLFVAAKRNIQKVSQPTGKLNMPPFPEITE